MDSPSKSHWQACKRLLRFLKGTEDYGLHFKPGDIKGLIAFNHANWGRDLDNRRSVGSFCIYYGGNLIYWSSKKQSVMPCSSTESEYRALSMTTTELVWISSLLTKLKVPSPRTLIIWCDNNREFVIVANLVSHGKIRHTEIDVHFVHDKITDGTLDV